MYDELYERLSQINDNKDCVRQYQCLNKDIDKPDNSKEGLPLCIKANNDGCSFSKKNRCSCQRRKVMIQFFSAIEESKEA